MDTLEIYQKTGTFAPLVNKREYTENEKIVLLHFFTNIDKNVYCATDAMSSQLWAFLVGQYSRSALSMRDRFLKLFEAAKKAVESGKLNKDEYISIETLAESIKNKNNKAIKYFNKKASSFLKKWGVTYGHNSLKDADNIRFAVEGISQVFTKVIEAPFPTLGNFQEKSTRYMHFGKENLIIPPRLKNSVHGPKIKELFDRLMDTYKNNLEFVKQLIIEKKIIKKEDFKSEIAYKNTLTAKVFDIVRYLLPSSISTCIGASFTARTLESHLSEMLSSELEEVRLVAKSIHQEALKVSPGLLSHVNMNEYLITKRKKTFKTVDNIFNKEELKPIIKGIKNEDRVKLIKDDNIDEIALASIMFEYNRKKGISFAKSYMKAKELLNTDKENLKLAKEVFESELGDRGTFDRMPRALQHGSVLFEFTLDFGAYRDIQRHRASNQLWQGANGILGYDYPEYINLPEFEKFKKEYDSIMTEITNLSRTLINQFPYDVEYISTLGHLVKTTFEMHPGQLAYVSELRTTPQGHHSYRRLFQQVKKIMDKKAPLYSKYIRVNENTEASRLKQEEKSAKKIKSEGLIDINK